MSYSRNPELAPLAAELASIGWSTALTTAEQDKCVSATSGHNLTLLPDGITWSIRFYLGGTVNTVGITRSAATAFRFSDMLLSRLWRYRRRGCRPPVAADLNFSPERLASDLSSEPRAVALLDQIESLLVSSLGLMARPATATGRRASRSRFDLFQAQLDSLRAEIEALKNPARNPRGVGG